MYKVIGSPGSRLTRVTWMLEELGQDYEIVNAKPHSPQLVAANPSGRGPILVDGDFTLSDSAAICVYLGEKHSAKGMGSKNAQERALIDSWCQFAQCELETAMWNKLKHRLMLPEELRVEIGPWVNYEFSRDSKALAARLGDNEFALGTKFSAVDVLLAHIGNWARNSKFEIASQTVNDYLDRCLARPALERAKKREEAAKAPVS